MSPKPSALGARDAYPQSRRRRIGRLVALAVILIGVSSSVGVGLLVYSGQRTAQRQVFATAATTLASELSTLVGRDEDFAATMRTVLTLNPHLTATQFSAWYAGLTSESRQAGGVGTAVVRIVPAGRLSAFQAQRDADPAFLRLVRDDIEPVNRSQHGRMCLAAAGVAGRSLGPLDTFLQLDWCNRQTVLGSLEAVALLQSADTDRLIVNPVNSLGLDTTLLTAAFYRPGAPRRTVAERRAAVAGWLVSSLDMPALARQALRGQPDLGVRLTFTPPGGHPVPVVGAGHLAGGGNLLSLRSNLSEPGWTAQIAGLPRNNGLSPLADELIVAIGGSLLTLLLALLILTFSRSRQRALEIVDEKTGQLRHQALHDALTGLPNRVLALDRAETMLARARREGQPIAALYIDIDGFKQINDTFGHAVGDRFLMLVAGRLRQVVRESDTAARLSGDEFVILMDGSTLDAGPHLVAERVLDVLREPYDLTARDRTPADGRGEHRRRPRTARHRRRAAGRRRHRPLRRQGGRQAIASSSTNRACTPPPRSGSRWRWTSATPWTPDSCRSSTSRRWSSARSGSSASRRCCAGIIPSGARSSATCSSRSPSAAG